MSLAPARKTNAGAKTAKTTADVNGLTNNNELSTIYPCVQIPMNNLLFKQ